MSFLVCCPAMPFKQSCQWSSVYATNYYLQTTQLPTPLSLNKKSLVGNIGLRRRKRAGKEQDENELFPEIYAMTAL